MDSVDVSLLDAAGQLGVGDEEEEEEEEVSGVTDTSTMDNNKNGDVASWLISLNLGDLVPRFYSQGYDDIDVIRALDDKDLDALGIDKPGVRKKLLLYASRIGSNKIPASPASSTQKNSLPPNASTQSTPPKLTQQPQLTPSPQTAKKTRTPYRCSKCCMFKVQSINKHNSHKCDEKLIGHTWENCPTNNLRAHPDEQENRRKRRAEERKKKKEENKKQKVERKRKQDQQREHPLVAIDWDTFREEELRRIIQANPERYSKDMEGQRLMEAMLIIIARYNELKGMVEQMKNKKRKFVSPQEEPMTTMTIQDVLDTNNRLAINSLQAVSPALLQQQMQLEQQLQHQETLEQHKLQLQHLTQLQQLQQQQQRQKQHEHALQAQALQTQQLQHQQRLVQQQQHQAQAQQNILQQHLVQQQMIHHHQQAQQAQLQQPQHPMLQSVVLQPGLVRHPGDD